MFKEINLCGTLDRDLTQNVSTFTTTSPHSFLLFSDDPIAKRSSVPQVVNPPEIKESERELDKVIGDPTYHLMCFLPMQSK